MQALVKAMVRNGSVAVILYKAESFDDVQWISSVWQEASGVGSRLMLASKDDIRQARAKGGAT